MTQYKHYSFDLWLTLIKSNPLFKTERTRIFHERFNPFRKPIEEVAFIFRQVDLMVNAINEKTGKNIDADEMYLMVINMISNFSNDFRSVDLGSIYDEMEELLFKYLPEIYSDETISTLQHLKKNQFCTCNILSNTGFIRGKTLREVLKRLGLFDFFDFHIYSDEVGMSKPNTELFKLMLNKVSELGKNCAPSDIVHIGDNDIADVKGAEIAGITGILINSNNRSINTLLCAQL